MERKVWIGQLKDYWPMSKEYFIIYSRCSENSAFGVTGWYVELVGKRATFTHPVQDINHADELIKTMYPEATLLMVYHE